MLQTLQLQQQTQQLQTENVHNSSVKLPKIEIMSFNGDKQRFHEFWDQFECTIHKNTKLSNVEKFTYLKGKLYGAAQSAISGLTLTNDNYNVALSILDERFGDKQDAVDSHYTELINLPTVANRTVELRTLYDKIERNFRSLEALGQNVDQAIFISMVTSKLPRDVMMQLEIQKGTGTKWSVGRLREMLKAHIQAREAAESHTKPDKPSEPKPTTQFTTQKFKPQPANQFKPRYSAEALVTTTQDHRSRYEPKRLCVYCQGSHWSDQCATYKTVEERKQK